MRRILWAVLFSLLAGCGNRSVMPYLGKWNGSFSVEKVAPHTAVNDPDRNSLKGFLQLYATNERFELHLDGEQFGLVSGGTWKEKGGRVTLNPTSVKIDDGGGQEARNPNKTWIAPADLNAAYSRPMALRLSQDGKTLTGLMIDVGPLTGTHSFVKAGFGH